MRYARDAMTGCVRIAAAVFVLLGSLELGTARAAGEPDATFEHVSLPPSDQVSFLESLVLQPGGEIVAGGSIGDISTYRDFLLVRVLSNGAFDPSFGVGGVVRTSIGAVDAIGDIVRQPDGRIVAAGGTGANSNAQTAVLVRYDDDGTLDPTFGIAGIVTTAIAGSAFAMVRQPDGALVIVAGSVVARFLDDGTPDPAFGTAGIVSVGHPVRQLVRQPDGTLFVAGQSGNELRLLRVLADGTFDPTFGVGGSVSIDLSGVVSVTALRRQSDGRLLIGGSLGSPAGILLARVLGDGTLDPTFGVGGIVQTDAGAISDMGFDADGNIIVVGSEPQGASAARFERYSAAGILDEAFPTPGTFNGTQRSKMAVLVQPDGRIVTAGWHLTYVAVGGMLFPVFLGEIDRYTGVGVCGDGTVDLGELCDDPANPCCIDCRGASVTDACTSDGNPCTYDHCEGVACVHEPLSGFNSCEDGDLCTTGDHCVAGVCTGNPPSPPPCQRCVPATGAIVASPRSGCRQTTQSGRSSLKVKDIAASSGDRLTWKWTRGEATTIAELGDPIDSLPTDGYDELCVFDESGPEPILLVSSIAPAGDSSCSKPPCWKRSGNRLTYKSAHPNNYGVTGMILTAGSAGKSSMRVTGKGERLFAANLLMPPPPPPPLPLPLRVQLGASDGACWEATFSASGVRKNATGTFVGASD